MSKIAISVVGSAAVLGSVVVAGVALSRMTGPAERETADVSLIESELSALRESVESLTAEVRALRADRESDPGIPVPAAAEAETSEVSEEAPSSHLSGYVAAVLAEERKLQEAERERQREERRTRMEARRHELEAMREGPYDRYNVKVNSLGKVLGLTDAQKRSYYDLTVAYNGKLEESLKQMREAREARRAAPGAEGAQGQQEERPRGPGRQRGDQGTRDQFREMYEGLQKSFATDVASFLSAEQAQAYAELSRSAQSFQGTDRVAASGEDDGGGRFGGFGRDVGGGAGGGGPRGGGRGGR